jgi:hypothetical protein
LAGGDVGRGDGGDTTVVTRELLVPRWFLVVVAEAAAAVEERVAVGFPEEAPAMAALLWWVWTVVCWHPVATNATGSRIAGRIFFMGCGVGGGGNRRFTE